MQTMQISDKQGDTQQLIPAGYNDPIDTSVVETEQPEWILTAEKLELWLQEIRNQPRWRTNADLEDDYYDGNQIDADTAEMLKERGQEAIIDNQIGPVIRTVLGMQAKSRTDTVVKPEAGETNTDVAEALSCKLKQTANLCQSDRAKSDAYAEMIKVGVSWLEVSTNDDPFASAKHLYEHVHRREMYWDWRSKKQDYSDARYLVRRKWVDVDELINAFPEKADFINHTMSGRAVWDMEMMTNQITNRGYQSEYQSGFDVTHEQYEWMNVTRRRLLTYEVWYRVKVRDLVFKTPQGKVVEFDRTNQSHMILQQQGMIQPYMASFDRIRVAFWIGPTRAGDWQTPYKHRHFPYVPLWCFRENRTGIPYGLIRCMMSPQNEINARKTKMMWLLNAKWVKASEDAVDDHSVAANEVSRPDGYVIVSNKPGELFEVHESQPMAAQQFQVMTEAKETLQTVAGVHNATLGRDSGATSGLAINSLVEQDSITLAEPNDNFAMACRHADGIFLENIIAEISNSTDHAVTVEDDFGNERIIVLNKVSVDTNTGLPKIVNDINKVKVSVVLGDVPQTPTFRNQQLHQLSETVKTLPPQIQAMLMPELILATDLPNRKTMADKIMKALGQGEEGQDPEKEHLKQQVQELEQKLAMKNPPELLAAQVAKLQAETADIKATTTETMVKALYEAMQGAGIVVQNPGVVPVADSIAKSAGFVDQNVTPLVNAPSSDQTQPGQPTQQFNDGNPNPHTDPEMPQPPAQPGPDQNQAPQLQPPMPSPEQGAAQGIETQRLG